MSRMQIKTDFKAIYFHFLVSGLDFYRIDADVIGYSVNWGTEQKIKLVRRQILDMLQN